MNIDLEILQNIAFMGFTDMTPIQELSLPHSLAGKDVIGQAKTGTGKTVAFAIPVIQKIDLEKRYVQAIILTPTRELAIQVGDEFNKLVGSGMRVVLAYGGSSLGPQVDAIKSGAQVVVGTPGRVIDLIKRNALKLDRVESLVLDEADRMLDMGFIDDVEWIVKHTPKERQTMLYSATMPDEIKNLSSRYMKDPALVSVNSDSEELTVSEIEQFYIESSQDKKMDAFFKVLSDEKPEKALVFCKTKRWVETLYNIMRKRRFSVDRIHGDLSQAARKKAVDKLKQGKIKFLVCTDVVARGIDIADITHVFNYDLPMEPMTYVHRIGRTARAGRKGVAVSFISPGQVRDLWLIEHKARTKIEQRKLDL